MSWNIDSFFVIVIMIMIIMIVIIMRVIMMMMRRRRRRMTMRMMGMMRMVRTTLIILIIMIRKIRRMIITLKGAIRDCCNLLTAPRAVYYTYAQMARAQSCANHLQHIKHLSRATCCVPCGARGQLNY